MTDLVSYAFADGVATLTMDDGKANVMNPAMQMALNAAKAGMAKGVSGFGENHPNSFQSLALPS